MTNLLAILPAFMLMAAMVALRSRHSNTPVLRLTVAITTFAICILSVVYVAADSFTGKGIDESVLFHVRYGLHGAGFGDYGWLLAVAAAMSVAGGIAALWIYRLLGGSKPQSDTWATSFLVAPAAVVALGIHPASRDLLAMPDWREYVLADRGTGGDPKAEFDHQFKAPPLRRVASKTPNLVFIYLEGLERTYLDDSLFPDLATELGQLERAGLSFTAIEQLAGTGWTIAGMTASQCGLPLLVTVDGNSLSGMDAFLPRAVCMGDLLKRDGYRLSYLGGASLRFAGKGNFYRSHGFDTVLGREELVGRLADTNYTSHWGLYDDSLFDVAYEEFLSLSKRSQAFGLFVLTLDTHHPGGLPSSSCSGIAYGDGNNPMLNAVKCSDELVGKFIRRIRRSEHAANTLVVVASDHLAMQNSASDRLNSVARRNLFFVLPPEDERPAFNHREGSTLDIAPTVLSKMGYDAPALGLGRNLLDPSPSLVERSRDPNALLRRWREPLAAFWDYPDIGETLEVSIEHQTMTTSGRSFALPVMLVVDERMMVKEMLFGDGDRELVAHLYGLDDEAPFMWIDACASIKAIVNDLGEVGTCLYAGRLGAAGLATRVRADKRFAAEQLRGAMRIRSPLKRVAHAGGGVDGKTYTNSFEALDVNLKAGFDLFELDFSWTADGHLVCLHDWEGSFEVAFGRKTQAPVHLAEFARLVATHGMYRNCTLDSLARWLRDNGRARIVTDVKQDNERALATIARRFPDLRTRFVPQIHDPDAYARVRDLGFEDVVWTLYRYQGDNEEVVRRAAAMGVFAVTMPKGRARQGLAARLLNRGIPSYVHTVNTAEELARFSELRVGEIYTDFLTP